MEYVPYIWPMIISAILLGAVLGLSFRYKAGRSIIHFRTMLASSILWCLSYALAIMSTELPLRIILTHAMISATAVVPAALILFSLEYTGVGIKISRGTELAFYLPCLLFSIAEWAMLPLFRSEPRMDLSGAIPRYICNFGPLYWIFVGYGALSSLTALAIMIGTSVKSGVRFRSSLLFGAGILLPLAVTILDSLGITPVPGIDFSPATMAVTAILFITTVVRNRMLGIVPIAHAILMDNIRDLVIVFDREGLILDWNEAAARTIGFRRESFPFANVSSLPQPWAGFLSPIDAHETEGEEFWTGEGDEARCYEPSRTPIADGKKRVLGRMCILHDITQAKRNQEALREYATQMERANRLREDMEMIVAHDMRSPLTGVISLPELMLLEGGLSPEQREMLGMIIQSGKQILDMVNRSLDMYRMEQGSYKVEWTDIDLLTVIDQVRSNLEDRIASGGNDFDVFVDDRPRDGKDTCIVRGEAMLAFSMLSNLARNAIEASPRGSPVRISMRRSPRVILSITNHGEIPSEIRGKVFEKGITAGKSGGTGLGVYSARLNARTMGAELSLDSSVSGMTTARIEFPPGRSSLPA